MSYNFPELNDSIVTLSASVTGGAGVDYSALNAYYVSLTSDGQSISGLNRSFLNNLSICATPLDVQHVITKGYLDSVSGSFGLPLQTLNNYFVSLTADQTVSGDKSFLNNIVLSATPSSALHLITKGYLDSITSQFGGTVPAGTYVSLSASETISGSKSFLNNVSLSATPSLSQHLITKGYLDSVSGFFVSGTAGGNFVQLTGDQSISGNKLFMNNITILGSPTASTHASTKGYSDNIAIAMAIALG